MTRLILISLCLMSVMVGVTQGASPPDKTDAWVWPSRSNLMPDAEVLEFHDVPVFFAPDSSLSAVKDSVNGEIYSWRDNGRVVSSSSDWTFGPCAPVRIIAHVRTRPIPKTPLSVHDIWDRAGSMSLVRGEEPVVEIVKFMTAYGGVTEHSVDVSWLAPFLRGGFRYEGFIDTWSNPGWRLDFDLEFRKEAGVTNPTWGLALFNEQSVTRELMDGGPILVSVEIPENIDRIELLYFVSGHCTDGRGADEFESKPNVLYIDGEERIRFEPWRDDCLQFRPINPYCKRWSDGSWSSDYSRSGWCPGDVVAPHRFDLTGLADGSHEFAFSIENIRPKDEDGNHGYWRVSALLLGWED